MLHDADVADGVRDDGNEPEEHRDEADGALGRKAALEEQNGVDDARAARLLKAEPAVDAKEQVEAAKDEKDPKVKAAVVLECNVDGAIPQEKGKRRDDEKVHDRHAKIRSRDA